MWPLDAELGEGPCWVDDRLWFVDILGQRIHCLEPDSGHTKSWPAPGRVSFVLPAEAGRFVVGLPGSLHRFDPSNGSFSLLVRFEADFPHNRTNDACVAPDGALWFGTLDQRETHPSGHLYRWDGVASAPAARDQGYVISNGPAFSPEGDILYHTDTLQRTVYAFDVGRGGLLSRKRAHIQVEDGAGWPDGTTVDAAGCLWIALWNGGAVRRYSSTGILLGEMCLPCARVTKVAFGGAGLQTLFVTTARTGLVAGEIARAPLSGGVFRIPVEVPGLPQARLRF